MSERDRARSLSVNAIGFGSSWRAREPSPAPAAPWQDAHCALYSAAPRDRFARILNSSQFNSDKIVILALDDCHFSKVD